jgi:hypothetical protein
MSKLQTSGPLKYYDGLKYEVGEDFWVQTALREVAAFAGPVRLFADGTLHIRKGFTWNGASGPTYDTKTSQRASLVHDALYFLMSEGKLALKYRPVADQLLADLGKQDGMFGWRASVWRWAVDTFGGPAARHKRKLLVAP